MMLLVENWLVLAQTLFSQKKTLSDFHDRILLQPLFLPVCLPEGVVQGVSVVVSPVQ